MQEEVPALIKIARNETDPELCRHAVEALTMVASEEATAFLMEILNE
jgi:hypothetical protein